MIINQFKLPSGGIIEQACIIEPDLGPAIGRAKQFVVKTLKNETNINESQLFHNFRSHELTFQVLSDTVSRLTKHRQAKFFTNLTEMLKNKNPENTVFKMIDNSNKPEYFNKEQQESLTYFKKPLKDLAKKQGIDLVI